MPMKNIPPLGAAVVTLLILLLAAMESGADVKQQAKASFEAGITHFDAHEYTKALAAFQTSYSLRKSPVVLFNIGLCQSRMQRPFDAISTFEALLDEPEFKADAEAMISELEGRFGRLELLEAPDGASVTIDDKSVGETPFDRPIPLYPGNHRVMISKRGYVSLSSELIAVQGETAVLNAALTAESAAIDVTCDADGRVYVDGDVVGACPYRGAIAPGSHRLSVKAPGKIPETRTVDAKAGASVTAVFRLLPESTAAAAPSVPALAPVPPRRTPGLLIGGIVTTALGVAGFGVGVAFSVLWKVHHDRVEEEIEKINSAKNRDLYDAYYASYLDSKDEWENHHRPTDRVGMIAGYVTGGVLTLTGITLLTVYGIREKKGAVAVKVAPTGVRFLF